MTELNEMTRSLYERARRNDIYRNNCKACKQAKREQAAQRKESEGKIYG